MSLPKYPEYKDSGVDWLGEVPVHWSVQRLRRIFEIRKRIAGEEGHQVLSVTQRGIVVKDVESNDGQLSMDYSKYQLVYPGDFAMNHMDLLTGYVDISMHYGVTSPDYRVFTVREGVEGAQRYFLYLFQNGYRQKIFYAFGQGASEFGRWRFPTDQFNDFWFPIPSFAEQSAIAIFLDLETAKIDALIAEQEKLLTLLAEKRQATISRAVTQGLNPDVPMKESGVAWLGKVPVHWSTCPLKFLAHIGNGSTPNRDNSAYWAEEGFPWLNSSVVNQEEVTSAQRFITPLALEECHLPIIEPPAALVGITGQGKTRGMATRLAFTATVNQHLAYIKPAEERLTLDYLLCVLAAAYDHLRTESEGVGCTKGAITCEQLGQLKVPLPKISEQIAIVSFLNAEIARLDTLTAEATRAIDLLKERRTALISAAVTGKIDVRKAYPPQQDACHG
ncbi:MAG TPA: restriction endonuclease subunit S [Burkholderiaceae bacterium]|nr:restriction endonuclease subunit S [Burkholderiaceae bacterium]